MNTVYIDPRKVAPIIAATFPSYRGRKVCVRAAESVTLLDLNWSGGSRSQYRGCSLETGQATGSASAGNEAAPWANPMAGQKVPLLPGFALVEYSIFCGKDMGLTIHVHPSMLPKLLPAAREEELTKDERTVLFIIRSLKSSYRREEAARHGLSIREYDTLVAALKEKGLLNGMGALTLKGKNAATGMGNSYPAPGTL